VPSSRERPLRSAVGIALGVVAFALLVGAYYLVQHLLDGDVYWPDTVGMAVVFGVLIGVVGGTYALAAGAVGLKIGAAALSP
jgi:hypothetical protein